MPTHKVRQKRKEKGLCTVCGKRPLVTISYCEECRISENSYKKQQREYRKNNLICLGCPQPAAVGDLYCVTCREIRKVRANKIDKKRYEKAKTLGLCIRCFKNPTLNGKVRCQDYSGIVTKQELVTGWINLFNLYLEMGGKCTDCGNEDLRVLVIDHIQYYNHHIRDNGKVWNKLKLSSRQSAKKRLEILQGHQEGKYQLLCANCNRLKELKRIGCDPYIQDALNNKYSGSWDQRTYGWINRFNLLKDTGGRCCKCGVSELAALEIHHIELFHHSKNDKEWESIRVKLRKNKTYRSMILQGFKEGKYSLLCCNCNKLQSQKQGRSEPYIQQALIQLDRLNINSDVEDKSSVVVSVVIPSSKSTL